MEEQEKRRFYGSMLFPAILLLLLWLIKIIEVAFGTSFSDYGLEPMTIKGLRGILFAPLLHADWSHLSSNSVPMFLLTAALFYYYQNKAFTIFALCWLITGFWVWIFAGDTGIHIGASGVVYALATFHFTGGLLRREPRMMAFSMLVVFLYGGLVWGISSEFFPGKNISWQSHLLGGLAGILIAFGYRKDGPQREIYPWNDDADEVDYMDDETTDATETHSTEDNTIADPKPEGAENSTSRDPINYIYKEKRNS